MTATATADTFSASRRSTASSSPSTLDDLLFREADELRGLYERASVPRLRDVHGDLRGRMLAIPALPSIVTALPRAWARTRAFPWRGKSFAPRSETGGEGINRVLSDRLRLFRFETFVGPSRAGTFDAVQLDYDLPENPFFIRAIKDEIRELRPGLYLGQAYLKLGQETTLGLYFALST